MTPQEANLTFATGSLALDAGLLASYASRLYSRILNRLGVGCSGPVKWVEPELFWRASKSSQVSIDPGRLDEYLRRPPTELHHSPSPEAPWLWDTLVELRQSEEQALPGREPATGATSPESMPSRVEHYRAASAALRLCWPAAAVEQVLLIREVAHLSGPDFSSCSAVKTFGCIYLGDSALASPESAFEAILHECGHHSLYLRQMYVQFVSNPGELTRHPLRPDDRPLDGALHAAFVLARIHMGLIRALRADVPHLAHGSLEAQDQRVHEHLQATLDAISRVADWTHEGQVLYRNLRTAESTVRI